MTVGGRILRFTLYHRDTYLPPLLRDEVVVRSCTHRYRERDIAFLTLDYRTATPDLPPLIPLHSDTTEMRQFSVPLNPSGLFSAVRHPRVLTKFWTRATINLFIILIRFHYCCKVLFHFVFGQVLEVSISFYKIESLYIFTKRLCIPIYIDVFSTSKK